VYRIQPTPYLNNLLNLTLASLLQTYFDSERFIKDKNKLKIKHCKANCGINCLTKCEEYIALFDGIARGSDKKIGLINYFKQTKAYKKRKTKIR
jgi:hypothetical protein